MRRLARPHLIIYYLTNTMNWKALNDIAQLETIKIISTSHPVLIFKHSTRCSISASVLNRLERKWDATALGSIEAYYLDLIAYRPLSNAIAEIFGVHHESPQVLLIQDGECVYDASHYDISFDDLVEQVSATN